MPVYNNMPRARSGSFITQSTNMGMASSSSPQSSTELSRNTSRMLLSLTLLPIALAAFAFTLEWKGGFDDPKVLALVYGEDGVVIPGWQTKPFSQQPTPTVVKDCNGMGNAVATKFPHQLGWHASAVRTELKLCITTTTAAGLDQVLPWLFYHKTLGVQTFLLFVEGKAATFNSTSVLETISGVKIIFRTKELEEMQAKSRIWNENWLSSFFFRPCNYELFVKQSLNMEMAIMMAQQSKMDWIMHIDTDELLYPGGAPEFSLQKLLADVPAKVDTVVFPNYETAVERDDVKYPFTEVTMFKKNYDHVTKEVYFGHYREATRSNPNYFLTYGNGKSAARVQAELRPNGAHRWHNYAKAPNELKLTEGAVLHYTYAKFSDLTSRRDRCGCKPNKDDVKKCFMLEFDRSAFIIASTQSEEEMLKWYREHVVWLDREVNERLLKKGLFARIYTPQVIVQGILSSGIIDKTIADSAGVRAKSVSSNAADEEALDQEALEDQEHRGGEDLLMWQGKNMQKQERRSKPRPQKPDGRRRAGGQKSSESSNKHFRGGALNDAGQIRRFGSGGKTNAEERAVTADATNGRRLLSHGGEQLWPESDIAVPPMQQPTLLHDSWQLSSALEE